MTYVILVRGGSAGQTRIWTPSFPAIDFNVDYSTIL